MTDFLKKLERFVALLASAAMSGIVLLVFINVVLRYCFNTGLTWSDEAGIDGLHLKVDVFTARLPIAWQHRCNLLAHCFVLLAMGILLIGGIEQVIVTNNNVSSATGIPFSYITVSMVVFAVSIILLTLHEMKDNVQNKREDVE